MKKLCSLVAFGLVLCGSLAAQEDGLPPSPLVVNYGVSMGVFPAPASTDPWAEVIQVAQTVASLRGGVEAQFTVPFGKFFWVGGGGGAYALSIGDGSSQAIFLDVPVRVVAKLGLDTSFAEVFAGSYWSVLPWNANPPLGGPEAGIRLALDGWYFEASAVWGASLWTRYGLGLVTAIR